MAAPKLSFHTWLVAHILLLNNSPLFPLLHMCASPFTLFYTSLFSSHMLIPPMAEPTEHFIPFLFNTCNPYLHQHGPLPYIFLLLLLMKEPHQWWQWVYKHLQAVVFNCSVICFRKIQVSTINATKALATLVFLVTTREDI